MYEYDEFDRLLGDLETLDPVQTLQAQLVHGPSARVSHAYDRTGRPITGPELPDDGWIDEPHEPEPGALRFDEGGDDA